MKSDVQLLKAKLEWLTTKNTENLRNLELFLFCSCLILMTFSDLGPTLLFSCLVMKTAVENRTWIGCTLNFDTTVTTAALFWVLMLFWFPSATGNNFWSKGSLEFCKTLTSSGGMGSCQHKRDSLVFELRQKPASFEMTRNSTNGDGIVFLMQTLL